ncbi:MAG: hypothetical protein NTV92_07895, partial [Candidatus Bipolaricaulota bacterium]|nr:hypothetical protein [Candidatus Bipolaricaulota bacterium]
FAKVYRTLADSIPAGVSRELRQALADRLRYGNEFSLRRRLAEIVGALSSEAQALIVPRLPDFMRKVVDTRNYLVQLDSRLKHRAMTETEMIEAMRPLGALLMLVVFVRIGIPEEFARDVLRESNQFERTRVIDWEEGT